MTELKCAEARETTMEMCHARACRAFLEQKAMQADSHHMECVR